MNSVGYKSGREMKKTSSKRLYFSRVLMGEQEFTKCIVEEEHVEKGTACAKA